MTDPPMSRRLRILHAVAVLGCAAVAVLHQTLLLSTWYIEDAAISFAYSRNLSNGLGLVPWSGGERVEGFSNPTWVGLLAALEWLGADAMLASKWVAGVLAAATVAVTYLLTRECIPARWREVPLLACGLLAVDPQFAIWGACGLENSLFSFLLASALTRSLVESRTDGRPWSAGLWFFLAITRPEGLVYCGLGLLLAVFSQRRHLVRAVGWVGILAAPLVLYHAARYAYFAWPFPMTYYAKLETKDPNVLRWAPNAGWKYVKDWGVETGRGLLVLAWVPAVVGREGWRLIGGVAALLVLATAFLFPESARWLWPLILAVPAAIGWRLAERVGPARRAQVAIAVAFLVAVGVAALLERGAPAGPLHRPAWWSAAPPYLVLGVLAAVPFLGIGTEGWRGRVACWLSGCLSVGFAVQALGDWMRGFRWLSLLSVPGAVLGAVGVAVVAEGLVRWARPLLARRSWGEATARGLAVAVGLTVLGVCGFGGWSYTESFAKKPETGPKSVRARVTYMAAAIERMKVEERVRNLDVDQGAHLWWSRWQMHDLAGLVDVPLAIHRFDRKFVQEYMFDEVRPHIAHLHGNWASSSRIPTFPEWKKQYVEIPGYGGGQLHVGNHVRRDLLFASEPPFPPEQAVSLAGDVTFAGFEIPSPVVATGGAFRVHLGLAIRKKMADNDSFRVIVFLSDRAGHLASWDAAPAYDWVSPSSWTLQETALGKYDFHLPDDLPAGTYDLGVVVIGPHGVLAPATASGVAPRFATGELLFSDALTVVLPAEARREAEADHDRALAAAGAADCGAAERAWFEARMHVPADRSWIGERRKAVHRALARCWIAVARASPADPVAAVAAVSKARGWDWLDPEVLDFGVALGAKRHAAAEVARAGEDWESAYRGFAEAVAVDPTRAWSRRAAEEMRAKRLGIDHEANKKSRGERQKTKRPPPPRVPAKKPPPPAALPEAPTR